jgi:PD-(D/E)XK nuclease superfamily
MPGPTLHNARYRDIAEQIAERLAAARAGSDPFAPWREEVVVASGGMAQSITRALLRRMPHGVAGLRLDTLDMLARRIVNANGELPRVATEAERRLMMKIAVRTIDDAMLESRGISAMLERSYRDVRDSGFTLAAFERRTRAAERSLRSPRRTRTILRVWYEYERLIARLGAVDPADLFERAAVLAPTTRLAPQLVAGFYEMTGVQRKLIEALPVAAMWIPSIDNRQPTTDNPVSIADTRHSELESVCAEIAALLASGVYPEWIGIVSRSYDSYDVRLLNRFAAAHGFTTSFAEETPLLAQRIGRAMATLLRIRERGFPRADVIELLRDGLRTKARARIDELDAETRRVRIAAGSAAELRLVRRPYEAYIAVIEEIEELTALDAVTLLERVPSLFRLTTDEDLAAAEAIAEIATMFRRAKVADATLVLDALEQRALHVAQALLPAIWLGDVMKLRGRVFTHLFAIRMQDDLFPMRRVEDPLIPDADRRALGLREIGNGRDEEQLLFHLIADGADHVRFSYAASDGFGKVLRASRFVKGWPTAVSSAPTTDNRQPTTRQLQLIAKTGTNSVFDGHIPPNDRFAQVLQSVSPTQLEDFGECPQKFLLKHILGVVDIDDPERELQINHRDKGTIDHRILERFYRSISVHDLEAAAAQLPLLPDAIARKLEALIDDAFDDLERDAPAFNRTIRTIERAATKRILRDFVAADFADLSANNLVPRHFEYRFGAKYAARGRVDHPEPFTIDAAGVPLRVEGSIDRIDTGADRLRIVDYKSGKALRHQRLADKIDRGVRLQLALYAMAASQFLGEPNVSGTIKPLVIGTKPSHFEFTLADKRERLAETLGIFATAIANGRFPAFPNEHDEDFNSCKYCPVNHSCRTKHEPEERYAIAQKKDPRTLLAEAR